MIRRDSWMVAVAPMAGVFMLGVDAVAVVMANPVIMQDLHTDVTGVMWATSAYLLTYSVPQLITGRLGDQFGPRNVYLWGLVLFTLCSLWCGLATSIGMLIVARTAQGFGAALIAPQVVALTVRTFPPDKRGEAMGLAGAMAGLAELVGLVLGGMLVGWFGWNWIFYVNVPIGVIGFALAWVCVPVMETYPRRFDLVGVGLFTVGMFLLVSGIQEGNTQRWNAWIWGTIAVGLVVLVVFLVGQAHNTSESLLPLNLFSDRNFALSNIATMALGAAMPMVLVPIYFWLQEVRDFSPVRAGALFAPAALATMVLRPVMGSISDRLHPRLLPTLGFSLFAAVAVGFAVLMTPDGSILVFTAVGAVLGLVHACIWAPMGSVATRNLPIQHVGAGSGVYNTTRRIASLLGTATTSALVSTHGITDHNVQAGGSERYLPPDALDKLSAALSQSMLAPVAVLLIGAAAAALLVADKADDEFLTTQMTVR